MSDRIIKPLTDIQKNIHLIEQHFEIWGIEKSHIILEELNKKVIVQSLTAIRQALQDFPNGFFEGCSKIPWLSTILRWEELLENEFETEFDQVWQEILRFLPQLSEFVEKIILDLANE